MNHPYTEYEQTLVWESVNKAIDDLVQNGDLEEMTSREHIVGYICKIINASIGEYFDIRRLPPSSS